MIEINRSTEAKSKFFFTFRLLPLAFSQEALMPLYDYECVKCSHVFEVYHKMNEGNETLTCPKCKAKKPKRLVSQVKTHAWSQFLDKMEKKINPHKFK
jgi:putative FmdB family regulatory protein